MTTRSVQKCGFSYPINIIPISILWGSIFILVDGYAMQHVVNRMNFPVPIQVWVLEVIFLSYYMFLLVALGGGIIFLFRRKFHSAFCYLGSACIAYASIYASLTLKGDRFAFTGLSHQEIADIYNQRRPELGLINSIPRLVPLDEQCHPPSGCECWFVLDPSHTSGVERDLGKWHRPKASLFPKDTSPAYFVIVDVRRLDPDAYSVLGCTADWTSWRPGW